MGMEWCGGGPGKSQKSQFAIFALSQFRGRPPPTSSPVKLRVKSCVNNRKRAPDIDQVPWLLKAQIKQRWEPPKRTPSLDSSPKPPKRCLSPIGFLVEQRPTTSGYPAPSSPAPAPQSGPNTCSPSPKPSKSRPRPPSPQPGPPAHSPAEPSPAQQKNAAQPSPAPLPASKPKHGFKKQTFGQNFRSKRYWHPNP